MLFCMHIAHTYPALDFRLSAEPADSDSQNIKPVAPTSDFSEPPQTSQSYSVQHISNNREAYAGYGFAWFLLPCIFFVFLMLFAQSVVYWGEPNPNTVFVRTPVVPV